MKEKEKRYVRLFLTFLKIGAFTFGGGYAMIPMIQKEAVAKRHWIRDEDILDIVAIAESTPGPIAVNSAIACVLRQFESLQAVRYAFFGIRAGVLALIIKALVSMYRQCPKNLLSCVLMAASFAAAVFFKVNVLLIIACCAAAGLVSTLAEGRRRS